MTWTICPFCQDDRLSCGACDDGWRICSNFMRVDDEDNFDVCSNCQAHRLDHKSETESV